MLFPSWDEWVPAKRILKFNSENIKKQKQIQNEAKKKVTYNGKKNTKLKEDFSSCSSTCSASDTASFSYSSEKSIQRTRKRTLNSEGGEESVQKKKICILDLSEKDSEKLKNSETKQKNVNIVMPESLKLWLIDDFDFIIQQNKIIRLPSKNNIEKILGNYLESKKNQNLIEGWHNLDKNSTEIEKKHAQNVDETINGLIKYFNTMLGSQLLYKFERLQYSEVI